jgi:hypothetical protein
MLRSGMVKVPQEPRTEWVPEATFGVVLGDPAVGQGVSLGI